MDAVVDPAPIVHGTVVKFLEDALDSARKGQLRAVLLVAEHTDGCTSGSWACGRYHSKVMLLGAVGLAAHRLAKEIDGA